MIGFIKAAYELAVSNADDRKQTNLEQKTKIEELEKKVWQLKTSEEATLSLLQKEQNKVNNLLQDIAKFNLGDPKGKDDHHFASKFREVFFSINEWVLKYYIRTTPEQLLCLESDIEKRLELSTVDSVDVRSNHPLYVIEALVGDIILKALFITPMTESPMEGISKYIQDSCKVLRNQLRG